MPPRVLLVGAYERDNVGDLLFLLVTERYLRGAEVVAAAPFAADMRPLVGRRIKAYPALLERERFDAVWTVGGQVGSIDAGYAYRLSASPMRLRWHLRQSAPRRRARIDRLGLGVAPYIPSPHPDDGDVLRIVNSAGVSGVRHVASPRRERLLELLRDQDRLAVRDRGSSDYLTAQGIDHVLLPDAVHALGILRPRRPDPSSDTALVQISRPRLAHLGHDRVAAALADSPQLRGLRIRLLMAGTAIGHDCPKAYGDVARRISQRSPCADVRVLRDRDPWTIVDQIAASRVVIASSLHVRIIAAAHAVPRISLARHKVTRYAETWDPEMPYDVTLDRLDAALAAAARARPDADHLARLANDQLRTLAAEVRSRTEATRTVPDRMAR